MASALPVQARRRRIRARRSALALATLFAPAAFVLLTDLARRGSLLLHLRAPWQHYYWVSAALSIGFWLLLLAASSRRRGPVAALFAVLFVLLFGLSAGVQGAFFSVFRTYDSMDADLSTRSLLWPWIGSLPLHRKIVWMHLAVGFGVAAGLVLAARALVRPRRRGWFLLALLAGLGLLALPFSASSYRPIQASTPDLLYFHAVSSSLKETLGFTALATEVRPQPRPRRFVPSLGRPTSAPNIVLVLQESQRADVTCTRYDPGCVLATRASNAAAPRRQPFTRWHALDSSTMLSCLTLWTGLLPSDPLEDLEKAPTLFGYAAARGYDTAYLTSQHLMFKNARQQMQDEPIEHFVGGTTLDLVANWDVGANDALLSDYAVAHWSELREPFFAVIHYSNAHSPYLVDPARSPFEPDSSAANQDHERRLAIDKNAVYLSDLAVARFLEALKRSAVAGRTIVFYTSDHGESLGEHGQSGHTVSLYETETHVPAWIDVPDGVLAAEQLAHLRAHEEAWLTHADFAPTVLDLMGAWDLLELAPFRASMQGSPLTRAPVEPMPLPMTNDSWIWESTQRNWGYLQGGHKLFGTAGVDQYHCFDLASDPDELDDLGEAACGDLGSRARTLFPRLGGASGLTRPLR